MQLFYIRRFKTVILLVYMDELKVSIIVNPQRNVE